MKNLLVTIIGMTVFSTALPAFAGPDWQIIEHGRKVKAEKMQAAQSAKEHNLRVKKTDDADNQARMKDCPKPCSRNDE
jgi:hypothetical protein